jgi:hypothetical protein
MGNNRFWSRRILQGLSKLAERRLVILHPELSISDATMVTHNFGKAIVVQFKAGSPDFSQPLRWCTHVGRKQYLGTALDCIVFSLFGCPGSGTQHLILPKCEFLQVHEDDNQAYFTVPNWIHTPVEVMFEAARGVQLTEAAATPWFEAVCRHAGVEVPALASYSRQRDAWKEGVYAKLWASCFVDLEQWVQAADKLRVHRHRYCGLMWEYYCLGKQPDTAVGKQVAVWNQRLATMQ